MELCDLSEVDFSSVMNANICDCIANWENVNKNNITTRKIKIAEWKKKTVKGKRDVWRLTLPHFQLNFCDA